MSTQTTTYGPGSYTYTAPSTLLNGSVVAEAYGAQGQAGAGQFSGYGGYVKGTVTVSAGGTLTVDVGDHGTNGYHPGGAGSLSGGHGGGSSAVLSGATVLIEAGGGGGEGDDTGHSLLGGTGGQGGLSPTGGSAGSGGSNTVGGGGGGGGHQGNGLAGGTGGTGSGGTPPGNGGSSGSTAGGGGAGGQSYAAASVSGTTFTTGSNGTTSAVQNGLVVVTATVADPPLAATQTGPANGKYLDSNAAGVTFTWTYNPGTDSGSQSHYALRVSTDGGAYQWWNATSGAFQSTEVFNASASSSATVPAGKLADGHTYTWSVATQESHYNLTGPYASDQTFYGTAMPTVTVTAPSGSTSTPTPTVTWTESLGAGDSQTSFRVCIYTSAVAGGAGFSPGVTTPTQDSGTVASAALSWTVPANLAQGSYVAYVQVTETGGVTSAWASSSFTVAYTGPGAPVVTATPTNDATTGAPIVSVLIDGSGKFTPGGVTLTNPTASLERSTDGGTTWAAIRNGTNVTVPTSTYQVTVVDHEAPFGVACKYRATLGATTSSPAGALVTSNPTDVTVTLTSSSWWLTDPLDTATALQVRRLGSVGILTSVQSPISFAKTNSEQMGVFYAFGRSNAIVQRGTKKAATFALNCWLNGYSEKATFDALVGNDTAGREHTLLVRSTMGDAWYVVIGPDIPEALLRATDQVTNPQFVVTGAVCTVTGAP